ncbi:unnamed protein product [Sphacelaria rigidula]
MVFVLKKDGVFECRKSEQGENAETASLCQKSKCWNDPSELRHHNQG